MYINVYKIIYALRLLLLRVNSLMESYLSILFSSNLVGE